MDVVKGLSAGSATSVQRGRAKCFVLQIRRNLYLKIGEQKNIEYNTGCSDISVPTENGW